MDWAQSTVGKGLRGHHRLRTRLPLRRIRHAARASDGSCFMTFETDSNSSVHRCHAMQRLGSSLGTTPFRKGRKSRVKIVDYACGAVDSTASLFDEARMRGILIAVLLIAAAVAAD